MFSSTGGYPTYGYGYGYGFPPNPTSPTQANAYPYVPLEQGEGQPAESARTFVSPGKPIAESPEDAKEQQKTLVKYGNPESGSTNPDPSNTIHVSQKSESVSVERLKRCTKSTPPTKPGVSELKGRKNQLGRQRALSRKRRIEIIEAKPAQYRTEEERSLLEAYYLNRDRKNDRSKERALEKKEEMERILAKPTSQRTNIEVAFLEQALEAKRRKNEGDRLRRERLKELGFKTKVSKPGVPARGPLPSHLAAQRKASSEASHTLSPPYGTAHYPTPSPHFTPLGYSSYPFPPVPYGASWEPGAPSFENPHFLPGDATPSPPKHFEAEEMKGEEAIVKHL